jgi:hypothetical protein
VILATQEVKIGRITVEDQPGQNVCETSAQQVKPGVVEHAYHYTCMGTINRRIAVQASMGINRTPYSKHS